MFLGVKELIYIDENARIGLVQTIHSLYRVLNQQKNFKRDLKSFMKNNKIDIEVRNNMIMAGTMDILSALGANHDSANLIILKAESSFASIFYFKSSVHENRGFLHQDRTCANKHKTRLDLNLYSGICPLFDDFIFSKAELDHMERFILATNINCIMGGLSRFYEILKADYPEETYKKWMKDSTTIKRYQPASCNENCRYYKECSKKSQYYTLSPVCNFHPRYNTGMKRKEDYGDDFSDDDEADMDDGGNVIDLYRAGAYVLHDGIYQCLYITDLPRVKYIVLSATLNAEVYAAYFKDRKIVEYEQVLCKYTGELIQYTYHSLGRDDLAKKQCIYDFISDMTNKKDIIKISFKSEDEKYRMNSRNIHYGNAIGINDFAGKDIAVIGTPYKHPIEHLLPCCYLYGAPIVNRDKKPVWRRVEYEGDSFMLNSFKEEKLQQYLVYSLESELEQCIGRARLLRFGCKVYLFAAYPCQQAKIITEDYLFGYYRETQECDQDIDASYHYEKERRSGRLCA